MYRNTFQDVLEAEKRAKQKWVLFLIILYEWWVLFGGKSSLLILKLYKIAARDKMLHLVILQSTCWCLRVFFFWRKRESGVHGTIYIITWEHKSSVRVWHCHTSGRTSHTHIMLHNLVKTSISNTPSFNHFLACSARDLVSACPSNPNFRVRRRRVFFVLNTKMQIRAAASLLSNLRHCIHARMLNKLWRRMLHHLQNRIQNLIRAEMYHLLWDKVWRHLQNRVQARVFNLLWGAMYNLLWDYIWKAVFYLLCPAVWKI